MLTLYQYSLSVTNLPVIVAQALALRCLVQCPLDGDLPVILGANGLL